MALAGDPLELRFKMRLARHRRGTPYSRAEFAAAYTRSFGYMRLSLAITLLSAAILAIIAV
jgi:hypothetical protein